MKLTLRCGTIVLAMTLLIHACSSGPDDGTVNDPPALPDDCTAVTSLMGVEAVLESGPDDCRSWLDATRGRVGRNGAGSFVVWSRRTADELALVIGANHTLGGGWYGPEGVAVSAGFLDPTEEEGIMRLSLPPADGALDMASLSPMFQFFHPEIPAEESRNRYHDIRPRHDYFVALMDEQRFEDEFGSMPMAEPLQRTLTPVYDPLDATRTAPTYAAPEASDFVLLVGYPQQGPHRAFGAAAVARVLSDAEAEAAIVSLEQAGDEEGQIPYDAEAEFLVEGLAVAGMSGGGAFDADGRLLGILVRATTTEGGSAYVRVVRMSHIASTMASAFEALSPGEQEAMAPFIEQ
jgi:hypothetical protein